MLRPELHLIDGENLVLRYQAMVSAGHHARPNVVHEKDVFVWHSELAGSPVGDVRRVTYYTSVVGDDDRIEAIAKQITSFTYVCRDASIQRTSRVVPRVFKKPSKSHKVRSVDINIVIDALTLVSNKSAGLVCVYSGDADFLPLIEELMRLGAFVEVRALSSGLGRRMDTAADAFTLLDGRLFEAPS